MPELLEYFAGDWDEDHRDLSYAAWKVLGELQRAKDAGQPSVTVEVVDLQGLFDELRGEIVMCDRSEERLREVEAENERLEDDLEDERKLVKHLEYRLQAVKKVLNQTYGSLRQHNMV